jgi:sodium transport system ATP-binding protein
MIEIKSVGKSFGAVAAVKDVSLLVPDGRITTLLGANGSGKTTTLRMISGLLVPDRGQIVIDGHDVATARAAAVKNLGFFPDRFGLYSRLSAREHVRYAGQLRGLAGKQLVDAVEDALTTIGIADLASRRAQGFSAGQRVKVALACTVVGRPRTLIFDEPTRALDLHAVKLLRLVFKRLRDQGHAILLASHVMADVEELSDSVAVMAKGLVVTQGTCAELKQQAGTPSLEDAFFRLSGFDVESMI